MRDELYKNQTSKSPKQFAQDFKQICEKYGFTIYNEAEMDQAALYRGMGFEVRDDFDLHMMRVCKLENSSQSVQMNPERAILVPKYVAVFSKDGATQIRFLHPTEDKISAVSGDSVPTKLGQVLKKIISMIEEAIA